MIEFYSKCSQPPRYCPPHTAVQERSPRTSFAKENMPITDTRSGILKIFEDRLSHFVLDRILLSSAVLRTPNGEYFALPVKVFQTQLNDLAAAQPINCEQQQEGLGAKMLGFVPLGSL